MAMQPVLSRQAKGARVVSHLVAAFREIGILLMALAPLEATMNGTGFGTLAFFFAVGLVLFGLALVWEWKSER